MLSLDTVFIFVGATVALTLTVLTISCCNRKRKPAPYAPTLRPQHPGMARPDVVRVPEVARVHVTGGVARPQVALPRGDVHVVGELPMVLEDPMIKPAGERREDASEYLLRRYQLLASGLNRSLNIDLPLFYPLPGQAPAPDVLPRAGGDGGDYRGTSEELPGETLAVGSLPDLLERAYGELLVLLPRGDEGLIVEVPVDPADPAGHLLPIVEEGEEPEEFVVREEWEAGLQDVAVGRKAKELDEELEEEVEEELEENWVEEEGEEEETEEEEEGLVEVYNADTGRWEAVPPSPGTLVAPPSVSYDGRPDDEWDQRHGQEIDGNLENYAEWMDQSEFQYYW